LHWADRLTDADVAGLIAHWAECAAWYGDRATAQPWFAADVAACLDRQHFWTEMREIRRGGALLSPHVQLFIVRRRDS